MLLEREVAFIYLEPKARDDEKTFAQCGACRMFVPGKGGRCVIHGSHVKVDDDDSCGFWVDWPAGKPNPKVVADHRAELDKGITGSVTPAESGLVDERVQCHRCGHYKAQGSVCQLYQRLNMIRLPRLFRLKEEVKPHACCNGWI